MTVSLTLEKAWQRPFIQQLSETGNISAACKKAKISRQRAYEVKDEDALFAAAWQEALVMATEALELEARRRATGWLEPVFYLSKKVGSIRRYSDTLMIFLLKAHKPDVYRDNIKNDHSGEITLRILYGDDGTDDSAT